MSREGSVQAKTTLFPVTARDAISNGAFTATSKSHCASGIGRPQRDSTGIERHCPAVFWLPTTIRGACSLS
jgi:hypothetical protein